MAMKLWGDEVKPWEQSLTWSRINKDEEAADEDPHRRLAHENAELQNSDGEVASDRKWAIQDRSVLGTWRVWLNKLFRENLRAKGVVKIHGTSHVSWEIFGWLGETEDACIQLVYMNSLQGWSSLQAGFAVTKVAVTSQNGLEWSRSRWSHLCHWKERFEGLAILSDFASVHEGIARDQIMLGCDMLSSLAWFPLPLSIAKNSIPHMGCIRTGYLFANGPLEARKTAHPLFCSDLWPVWWFCQQGVTPCQGSLWFLWPGHLSSVY